MLSSSRPALILATLASCLASVVAREFSLQATVPFAASAASENTVSSNVLNVKKSGRSSRSMGYLNGMRGGATNGRYGYGATPLSNMFGGEGQYVAEIEFAGAPVKVIVDTGSADTWLVQQNFQCVDIDGKSRTEDQCSFGPAFNGTFQDGQIPDENFNITYGDLEFLNGNLGYQDVTVAGITVKKQKVALVNLAFWNGDNTTSGLMGLAFPALTSAYATANPQNDSADNLIQYDPIFTTMSKEKLVAPVFSLAQERNTDSGILAFGGLPPVKYNAAVASTPMLFLDMVDSSNSASQYTFYTIVADSYVYSGSENVSTATGSWGGLFPEHIKNNSQFPIIVDSGTSLTYLPTDLANSILAQYDPPPTFVQDQGATFAACDAKVPTMGVEIGGQVFWINAADMLLQNSKDQSGTLCLTGLQDGGGEGPYILGDTFMNNVVSIFDVGASQMRFARHDY